MDLSDLDPNPSANSYYARLDITRNADDKYVSKAGKVAMGEFSETETDLLLSVKQARNTLTDSRKRSLYDDFLDEFGVETGTRAFEDWEQSGEPDVDAFKQRLKSTEETTSSEFDWSEVEITDPTVVRSQSTTNKYVEANLWEDDRLYLNNFHSDDVYIDVDTGRIYTQDYQEVEEIKREVSEDNSTLKLQHEDQTLVIDLTGESSWDEKIANRSISPTVEWVDDNQLSQVDLSYWDAGDDVASRLYLNGFPNCGDMYINIETGLVHDADTDQVIQSATCNLNEDGDTTHLSVKGYTMKISLVKSDYPTPLDDIRDEKENETGDSDDDPDEDDSSEDNDTDDRRRYHEDTEESDELEDAYDGKEFGYEPEDKQQDTNDDDSKDTNQRLIEASNSLDFYTLGDDPSMIQYIIYAVSLLFYPGAVMSHKVKWRWQIIGGSVFVVGIFAMSEILHQMPIMDGVLGLILLIGVLPFHAISLLLYISLATQYGLYTNIILAFVPIFYWVVSQYPD